MKKYPLYVTYTDECIETIEDTYGEDGPYTGFRHERYLYTVNGIYTKKPTTAYYEQCVLNYSGKGIPKEAFVVIVKYSTGGTFSRTDGRGHIVGVYQTADEAKEIAELIDTGEYDKKNYRPWVGHFEHLECVEIEVFDIKDKEGNPSIKRKISK